MRRLAGIFEDLAQEEFFNHKENSTTFIPLPTAGMDIQKVGKIPAGRVAIGACLLGSCTIITCYMYVLLALTLLKLHSSMLPVYLSGNERG